MSHRSTLAAFVISSTVLAACGAARSDTVDVSPRQDQGMARPDPGRLDREPLLQGPTATAEASPPVGGWSLFAISDPMGAPPRPPALAFGTHCEAGQTEASGFGDVCGTKNRVAIEFDGARTIMTPNPPCQLVTFTGRKPKDQKGPPVMDTSLLKSACVSGEDLLASGSCQMCRIPWVGWSFHGRVNEMTKAQNSALLAKLDMTGDPPTTAKGWAQLIGGTKSLAMQ